MYLKKLKLSSLYWASKEKGFFHITINSYDIIIGVIFLQNKYLYQILDIFYLYWIFACCICAFDQIKPLNISSNNAIMKIHAAIYKDLIFH